VTQSNRIRRLCNECGVLFETKTYMRSEKGRPAEMKIKNTHCPECVVLRRGRSQLPRLTIADQRWFRERSCDGAITMFQRWG
jgi:hypothetical protein